MKESVRKEESRKRGSNVAWKRAVKVIRALGRCLLDVGEEFWIRGKNVAQEEKIWRRGSDVAWERAVKVVGRALGACWLDVVEEIRKGGKEGAQKVSVLVVKALITCRLDSGEGVEFRGGG